MHTNLMIFVFLSKETRVDAISFLSDTSFPLLCLIKENIWDKCFKLWSFENNSYVFSLELFLNFEISEIKQGAE
jgi:hypothetical protein